MTIINPLGEAWAMALADSTYLVSHTARRRALTLLDKHEDKVSIAAEWLLLDGGSQQGLNPAPWAGRNKLSTERWNECINVLVAALGRHSNSELPTFPTTPEGWCLWYQWLDAEYDTLIQSPTHHRQRCPMHGNRVTVGNPSRRTA